MKQPVVSNDVQLPRPVPKSGTKLSEILEQRGKVHGEYAKNAQHSQDLQTVFQGSRNWSKLSASQRETLQYIAHKVARILDGNPDEPDHWDDIAGYSTLQANILRGGSER